MSESTFNPKIKLEIDATKAVDQLSKLADNVSRLKRMIEEQNRDHVDINTDVFNKKVDDAKKNLISLGKSLTSMSKDATGATKAVGDELDKLRAKTTQKITFDGLITALDKLASRIDQIITSNINALRESLRGAARDAEHTVTTMNNQHISRTFNQLKKTIGEVREEVKGLSKNKVEVDTAGATENTKILKNEIRGVRDQLENKRLSFQDDKAVQQITNLIRLVAKLKEQLEDLSKKSLNVNITNEGFAQMIKSVNNMWDVQNQQIKRTSYEVKKQKIDFKDLHSSAKATSRQIDSFVGATAKGTKNLSLMKKGMVSIKSSADKTKDTGVKFSEGLLKGFYATRGLASVFEQAQMFSYQIWQNVENMGRSLLNTAIPALKKLNDSGFEMANTFETARIGFKLFFPNDNPDTLSKEIKKRAIDNTAFNSADLAKYAGQFAPISNGDSKLALDALEGIADLLMASGQEVSTYLDKIVTNTIQVVTTGKATARDWREFTQKVPVFEKILKSVQPDLAQRVKDPNAEISQSDTKYLLQALQLVHTKSGISNVSKDYARSYAGLKQQMQETIQTTMDEIVTGSGFYDAIKNVFREQGRMSDALNSFIKPIYTKMSKFVRSIDFDKVEQVARVLFNGISEIGKTAVDALREITGGSDIYSIAKKGIRLIVEIIKGYIDGLKTAANILKGASKLLNIPNLSSVIGWLASPAGRGISQAFTGLAGIIQSIANASTLLEKTAMGKTFLKGSNMAWDFIKQKTADAIHTKFGLDYSKISALGKAVGKTASALLKGAIVYFVNEAVTSMAASITGGDTGLTALAGVATGGIGGAMAGGSVFGAPGAAIGGAVGALIGGLRGAAKATEEFAKRVKQATEEANQKRKDAWDAHAKPLADQVFKALQASGHGIDTNSAVGKFAYNQVKEYFRQGGNSLEKAMDIARKQYRSKLVNSKLDEYTESKEFRALGNTGNIFKYKGSELTQPQRDRRDKLAELLKLYNLNGDSSTYSYDDKSNEEIISDYFKGTPMTEEQVTALLKNEGTQLDATRQIVNWNIPDAITKLGATINNSLTGKEGSISGKIDSAATNIVNGFKDALLMRDYDAVIKNNQELMQKTEKEDWWAGKKSFQLMPTDGGEPFTVETKGGHMIGDDATRDKVTKLKEDYMGFRDRVSKQPESDYQKELLKKIDNAIKFLASLDGSMGEAVENNSIFPNWKDADLPNHSSAGLWGKTLREWAGLKTVRKFSGGPIGVDTVPVMAQRGEFVVRKSVVDKVGLPAMSALNLGDTKLASSLMGRPNTVSDNHARTYNDTTNNNHRSVRQFIKIINKNNSGAGNSYRRLGARAALGAIY